VANRVYPSVLPNPVTILLWDGSDFRAALCDATGHLLLPTTSLPAHDVLDNYDLWYFDRYAEAGFDADAGAGTNTKNLATVPAGEVWQIRHIWCKNVNTICNRNLQLVLGGVVHDLAYASGSVNVPTIVTGSFVLAAGDNVRVVFLGCNGGDDLYWGAGGVKSKIA
jgi:hypothetical protein